MSNELEKFTKFSPRDIVKALKEGVVPLSAYTIGSCDPNDSAILKKVMDTIHEVEEYFRSKDEYISIYSEGSTDYSLSDAKKAVGQEKEQDQEQDQNDST